MTREQKSEHWRPRLRTEQDSQGKDSQGSTASHFYQLVPCTHQSQGSGVHIHLGKNLRIELDRGFDPFTLRTVLEAVGGRRPCCPTPGIENVYWIDSGTSGGKWNGSSIHSHRFRYVTILPEGGHFQPFRSKSVFGQEWISTKAYVARSFR